MSEASLTARAVEFIREKGVARSYEIEAELGIRNASALLAGRVQNGQLVCCKVERPGKHPCNEFRLSVNGGGKAPIIMPLRDRSKMTPPQRPDLERKNAARQAPNVATPGADARADSRKVESAMRADCSPVGAAPLRTSVVPRKNGAPAIGALEDGIPVPARNATRTSPLREPLAHMKVGQSFYTTCEKSTIANVARKLNIKIRQAQEGEGRRVWRVA